jgi:hypothetical protein
VFISTELYRTFVMNHWPRGAGHKVDQQSQGSVIVCKRNAMHSGISQDEHLLRLGEGQGFRTDFDRMLLSYFLVKGCN